MFLLAFLLLVVQPSVPHRTVEMTPVAAEGELAKELGRYGMTAWRTTNKGPGANRVQTGSDMVTTVNYHSSGSL